MFLFYLWFTTYILLNCSFSLARVHFGVSEIYIFTCLITYVDSLKYLNGEASLVNSISFECKHYSRMAFTELSDHGFAVVCGRLPRVQRNHVCIKLFFWQFQLMLSRHSWADASHNLVRRLETVSIILSNTHKSKMGKWCFKINFLAASRRKIIFYGLNSFKCSCCFKIKQCNRIQLEKAGTCSKTVKNNMLKKKQKKKSLLKKAESLPMEKERVETLASLISCR